MKLNYKYIKIISFLLALGITIYYVKYTYLPKMISSEKIINKTFKDSILGVGYITAEVTSDLSSQINGKINKINVKEGQSVKTGEVLAKIDDNELKYTLDSSIINNKKTIVNLDLIQANISKIETDLTLAKVNLEKAKLMLDYNKIELDRSKKLLLQNNMTQQVYDNKKMLFDISEKEVKTALISLESLKIEKDKQLVSKKMAFLEADYSKSAINIAKVRQEYTEIKAPFDGVVIKRLSEDGMVLNVGTPLIRLVKKDSYLVSAYIDVTKMQNVKIGQNAEIILNRNPNKRYQGKVYRIAQEGDRTTEELKIDIKFNLPPENLYLDEKAIIEILLPTKKKLKLIPSKSIIMKNEQTGVYILENGKAVFKKVKVSGEDNGFSEITEGLNDSDLILYSNSIIKITENQPITIKEKK